MKVIKSIGMKISILFLIVTIAGLYLMAETIGSILLGVPMDWITISVIGGALLWEAAEWVIPWGRLKWQRFKRMKQAKTEGDNDGRTDTDTNDEGTPRALYFPPKGERKPAGTAGPYEERGEDPCNQRERRIAAHLRRQRQNGKCHHSPYGV